MSRHWIYLSLVLCAFSIFLTINGDVSNQWSSQRLRSQRPSANPFNTGRRYRPKNYASLYSGRDSYRSPYNPNKVKFHSSIKFRAPVTSSSTTPRPTTTTTQKAVLPEVRQKLAYSYYNPDIPVPATASRLEPSYNYEPAMVRHEKSHDSKENVPSKPSICDSTNNPCLNNGVCIQTYSQRIECDCVATQFYGRRCETPCPSRDAITPIMLRAYKSLYDCVTAGLI